jgi:hypothetical protein
MATRSSGSRRALDQDAAGVERALTVAQRRDSLHQAIVAAVADIARFVQQDWRIDAQSLRFDGRLLFVAATALARYERLTNARLHARVGYEMQAWLVVSAHTKARVRRARDACVADLAGLGSVSQSKDLPAARRALRMDGPAQTPEQSEKRQRYRSMAQVVAANLERRVASFGRALAGQGIALPGHTMASVYAIVAAAFSGEGESASPDTVRRAWIAAKQESAQLRQLQDSFDGLRAELAAAVHAHAAAPTSPPQTARPRDSSEFKKSTDRILSRKR